MKGYTIYTEGCCLKNPGSEGGINAVIMADDLYEEISEGCLVPATNNFNAELVATNTVAVNPDSLDQSQQSAGPRANNRRGGGRANQRGNRAGAGDLDAAPPGELIDLNSASLDELLTVPMINGMNANGIIDGRPWSVVEDLIQLQGFGPMKLRRVLPYVTVEPIIEIAEEAESVDENREEPETLDEITEEEVLEDIVENSPESEDSLPD